VVVVPVDAGMVGEVVEPQEGSTVLGHVLESILDPFRVVVSFRDGGRDHLVSGPVFERVRIRVISEPPLR
jgi:hypothetical protein